MLLSAAIAQMRQGDHAAFDAARRERVVDVVRRCSRGADVNEPKTNVSG